jgi:hypothetical protein
LPCSIDLGISGASGVHPMKWRYDEASFCLFMFGKRRETSVSTHPSITRAPRRRRSWKPAAAITAGGAALVAWFEGIIATAVEFIGVIFMFMVAGVIYLFNVYVFNSAAPKADDRKKEVEVM